MLFAGSSPSSPGFKNSVLGVPSPYGHRRRVSEELHSNLEHLQKPCGITPPYSGEHLASTRPAMGSPNFGKKLEPLQAESVGRVTDNQDADGKLYRPTGSRGVRSLSNRTGNHLRSAGGSGNPLISPLVPRKVVSAPDSQVSGPRSNFLGKAPLGTPSKHDTSKQATAPNNHLSTSGANVNRPGSIRPRREKKDIVPTRLELEVVSIGLEKNSTVHAQDTFGKKTGSATARQKEGFTLGVCKRIVGNSKTQTLTGGDGRFAHRALQDQAESSSSEDLAMIHGNKGTLISSPRGDENVNQTASTARRLPQSSRVNQDGLDEIVRNLVRAVHANDKPKLEQLLSGPRKVAINMRHPETRRTTLHEGVAAKRPAMVALLLQRGANPDVPHDSQGPPLLHCAALGDMESASLLIDKGADINAADALGFTALHYACQMGHVEMSAMLLARGASEKVHNHVGQIPCQLADSPRIKSLFRHASYVGECVIPRANRDDDNFERVHAKKHVTNLPKLRFDEEITKNMNSLALEVNSSETSARGEATMRTASEDDELQDTFSERPGIRPIEARVGTPLLLTPRKRRGASSSHVERGLREVTTMTGMLVPDTVCDPGDKGMANDLNDGYMAFGFKPPAANADGAFSIFATSEDIEAAARGEMKEPAFGPSSQLDSRHDDIAVTGSVENINPSV